MNMKSEEKPKGQVILYRNKFEVRLEKETVWLSLNQMADLFRRDKSVVSRHLQNVFKTKELERKSTVAFFATVQNEGGRLVERKMEYFTCCLDAYDSLQQGEREGYYDKNYPKLVEITIEAERLFIFSVSQKRAKDEP